MMAELDGFECIEAFFQQDLQGQERLRGDCARSTDSLRSFTHKKSPCLLNSLITIPPICVRRNIIPMNDVLTSISIDPCLLCNIRCIRNNFICPFTCLNRSTSTFKYLLVIAYRSSSVITGGPLLTVISSSE